MWVPSCLFGFLWKPALHVFAFLWNAFSITCFRGFFGLFWDSISTCSFIFLPATCFLGGKRDHLMFCYVEMVHSGSWSWSIWWCYCKLLWLSNHYPSTCICNVLHYLLTFVYQLKCFGMQSPRTKECTAASSITRINDCLDSPVSLIPSGIYTNTSHILRVLTDEWVGEC